MLYNGKFNLNGHTFNLYTHAKSANHSYYSFLYQIHNKTKTPLNLLKSIFDGSKDNYNIKESLK